MEELEQPGIQPEEAAELEESAPSEETEEHEPTGEDAPAEPPKSKGVQKRIDELVRQREEERRRADRLEEYILNLDRKKEQPEPQQQPQFPELPPVPPDRYAFDSDEQYAQAVQQFQQENARFVQGQIRSAQEEAQKHVSQEQRQQQVRQGLAGMVQKGSEAHPDFSQVAFVPQGMEEIFLDAENGAEVAYYLGQNPQEVQRILQMPAHRAAFEIARLDARFTKQPSKPSSAPPPIKPVGGKEPVAFDPNTCSADEYRKWRMNQQKG